jgi:hypothetical protein
MKKLAAHYFEDMLQVSSNFVGIKKSKLMLDSVQYQHLKGCLKSPMRVLFSIIIHTGLLAWVSQIVHAYRYHTGPPGSVNNQTRPL